MQRSLVKKKTWLIIFQTYIKTKNIEVPLTQPLQNDKNIFIDTDSEHQNSDRETEKFQKKIKKCEIINFSAFCSK